MNILFTGFFGDNNPSKLIIDKITCDKILFPNLYDQIDTVLNQTDLEKYDLIVMLGLRNNLKKSIRLESSALINNTKILTKLNCEKIKLYFVKNDISCIINNKPASYLCNYAYYHVLTRNAKAIFIHLPDVKYISNLERLTDLIKNISIATCT